MNMKVIAIGNILMKDDAIAIEVAREIEEELLEKGIEVIYGETDFEYCISRTSEEDYIVILDAAHFGKEPGEVTFLPLNSFAFKKNGYTQHGYSFLDLITLFYPHIQGEICAIEIHEVEFGNGLSPSLQGKLKGICKEILSKIDSSVEVDK
jgi:hydrogenase maturation protease